MHCLHISSTFYITVDFFISPVKHVLTYFFSMFILYIPIPLILYILYVLCYATFNTNLKWLLWKRIRCTNILYKIMKLTHDLITFFWLSSDIVTQPMINMLFLFLTFSYQKCFKKDDIHWQGKLRCIRERYFVAQFWR